MSNIHNSKLIKVCVSLIYKRENEKHILATPVAAQNLGVCTSN